MNTLPFAMTPSVARFIIHPCLVANVRVPTAKALELFMVSLITKAAEEVRLRGGKRVTAGHLKQAVLKEEQFDFLAEIIAKIPDIPPPGDNALGDATGDEKKTRKPRRKKETATDEDDF